MHLGSVSGITELEHREEAHTDDGKLRREGHVLIEWMARFTKKDMMDAANDEDPRKQKTSTGISCAFDRCNRELIVLSIADGILGQLS